jgi:DNA-binding transcriptional LysR family regulator
MSNIGIMGNRYDFNIDLRQLRYFVAVAEELHFGRAAVRLGMAQPPLTQQIQKLEASLGYPVFLRRPRKTSLTDAGNALLDDARRILRDFDEAVERSRRAGRGETGQLTVGAPPSVMLTRFPTAIRKYRERYPEVRFTLRELSTSAISDGLEAGSLDVGLLREGPASRTGASRADLRLREAVVAVLPSAHALATREGLKLRHLAEEPFVFFPRRLGEAFYDLLISFCVQAGFTPRVVQEATQWQSVVTFVETGLGVSIAPACVQRFRWKGVVYRPLPGLSTSVSVCLREEKQSAAVSAFLKVLRAEFKR